jgi:diaminopimelate decarboxylase
VAAAAVVTLCRVVAVRGDAGRVVVEVDAGTSSTVGSRTDRAAMLLGRLSPAQDRRVDIVAAACSTRSDTIQTLLPADIKVGDLIALPSVGDAAFAMTTSAVHVAVAAGRSWPLLESGPTRHGLLRRRVG